MWDNFKILKYGYIYNNIKLILDNDPINHFDKSPIFRYPLFTTLNIYLFIYLLNHNN